MNRLIWPLVLLASCAAGPHPLSEKPAPRPYAIAPGVDHLVEGEQPTGIPLEANASLSGRLVREGQVVRYPLPTEAGQLSLIDCEAWGYARGTESQGQLRVLDRDSKIVASVHLAGRTLHQAMLPFLAGDRGPYQLELQATEAAFRYVLVRHSSYAENHPDQVRDLGQNSQAQGWLAGQGDPVAFKIHGLPGQRFLSLIHI